jgi:hypothetical protein
MLSRLADSLFWLGRYVERAENVARFIGVNLNLMLDLPMEKSQQWRPLAVTTGDYAAFEKTYGEPTRENVIRFLGAVLHAKGQGKRPHQPGSHFFGNVGTCERLLPSCQRRFEQPT